MTLHGTLWLAKSYPSTLISVFLTRFLYFSYQIATQMASRGWVDPVPDPILPENFLGYSRESNTGSLGRQTDVLTTMPNRRSHFMSFHILIHCHPSPHLRLGKITWFDEPPVYSNVPDGGERSWACRICSFSGL